MNLSTSFSKTVQEWEKIKEQRNRRSTSPPTTERKSLVDKKSRKDRSKSHDRDRSRQSRERDRSRQSRDRSRQKYDKEMQKIEKKEIQIERERQKLEKMKMKLDISCESSSGGSEGRVEGMSPDFVKKLEEWQSIKGLPPDQQPVPDQRGGGGTLGRAKSHKHVRDLSPRKAVRERQLSDSSLSVPTEHGSSQKQTSTLSLTSTPSPVLTPVTPDSSKSKEAARQIPAQPQSSPQPEATEVAAQQPSGAFNTSTRIAR